MIITQKHTWLRITLLTISVTLGSWLAHHFFVTKKSEPISIYNDARDKQDVANLFKDDWFWLSARPYSADYVSYILDNRAPNNNETQYKGALNIAVLRDKGVFVGFVAFYKRSATEGQLLFLAVKKDFRGKRYGEQLLHYGVCELFRMGSAYVWLVTREENLSAQKLYHRFGFIETERANNFVYFNIWPHNMKK